MGKQLMLFAKEVWFRIKRLVLTVISKQWVVFVLGTHLLVKGYITAEVWFMLAGVVIGVNVFQKLKGIENNATIDTKVSN